MYKHVYSHIHECIKLSYVYIPMCEGLSIGYISIYLSQCVLIKINSSDIIERTFIQIMFILPPIVHIGNTGPDMKYKC